MGCRLIETGPASSIWSWRLEPPIPRMGNPVQLIFYLIFMLYLILTSLQMRPWQYVWNVSEKMFHVAIFQLISPLNFCPKSPGMMFTWLLVALHWLTAWISSAIWRSRRKHRTVGIASAVDILGRFGVEDSSRPIWRCHLWKRCEFSPTGLLQGATNLAFLRTKKNIEKKTVLWISNQNLFEIKSIQQKTSLAYIFTNFEKCFLFLKFDSWTSSPWRIQDIHGFFHVDEAGGRLISRSFQQCGFILSKPPMGWTVDVAGYPTEPLQDPVDLPVFGGLQQIGRCLSWLGSPAGQDQTWLHLPTLVSTRSSKTGMGEGEIDGMKFLEGDTSYTNQGLWQWPGTCKSAFIHYSSMSNFLPQDLFFSINATKRSTAPSKGNHLFLKVASN